MELRRRECCRRRQVVERSLVNFVGELFVVSSGEDAAKNTTHRKVKVTSLLPANPPPPQRSLGFAAHPTRNSTLIDRRDARGFMKFFS
jgi:hypothetical protein